MSIKHIQKLIVNIINANPDIPGSWGLHNGLYYDDEPTIQFKVNSFKLKGTVVVRYNRGTDLFDISFYKGYCLQAYKTLNGIGVEELVSTIDNEVEKTGTLYKKRVTVSTTQLFSNN